MTSVAKRLSFLLPALLLAACSSQPDPADELKLSGQTMGTTYHITISAPPADLSAQTLQSDIDTRLESLNAEMSTYIPESVISAFNESSTTEWFGVSEAFAGLVELALQISDATSGAYDITVGPLVDLWGFGAHSAEGDRIPSDEDIAAAKARVGYDKLFSRAEPSAIRKVQSDLQIDLSSIAKGFGVDQIALLLDEKGVQDYLVEIGGELRVQGQSPRGDNWKVAVEKPEAGKQSVQRILNVGDIAVATSGDYRNYFEKDGARYSHTIDSVSGRPVAHSLVSVTVLDAETAKADAWATALMALGDERGPMIAEGQELAAYFIIKTDDGFIFRETPAFKKLTSQNEQ